MFNLIFKYLLFILGCLSISACTAPDKNLWPRWQVNNPASKIMIDHGLWQQFLIHNVVTNHQDVNLVPYGSVSDQDKKLLEQYLTQLSAINIDNYNRDEQLAYWVNLYNALTVNTVLHHYPVKSILKINISPGWFDIGPWNAKLITVNGISLTLNDIEHRIIRPIWNDPRTHYLLNCASYSCPNLQKTTYTGDNIHQLLNNSAKEYVNDHRGIAIQSDSLIVSQIYSWYRSDFGGTDQNIISHIMQYAKPDLKKKLESFRKINGYKYNWELNAPNS